MAQSGFQELFQIFDIFFLSLLLTDPWVPFCSLLTSMIHHFQPSVLSSAAQLPSIHPSINWPRPAGRSSTSHSETPWHHDTRVPECNCTSQAIHGIWSSSSDTTWHLDWDALQKVNGCLTLFKQMKALVEVMNTALFYRKAQLLELVLVKWVVCNWCICACLCLWLSVI